MEAYASEPKETVTRKKRYEPDDDKDYKLTSVSIDEAENGVVVCCSYDLTDEAEAKVKKSGGSKYDYGCCSPEKHVFQSKQEAKAFITAEFDKLWSEEEGE